MQPPDESEPGGEGSGGEASSRFGRDANLVRLGVVDSTNRWLRDAALAGAPSGLVVVADVQSAGRGRRGRTWEAPAGSALLCSMLFRPGLEPPSFHLVVSAVALGALEALDGFGVGASLKWPNDLMAGERKLGGMLAEVVSGPAGAEAALVVGLGLNLEWPPGWPDDSLAPLVASATTVSAQAGRSVEIEPLLASLLEAVERRVRRLGAGDGPSATLSAYRARCSTIGRRVRVELVGSVLEGVATDVADDGRLLVASDGATLAVDAADVVHLRPAGP